MATGDGSGGTASGNDSGDPEAHDRTTVRRTFDRIAGHFSKTREYPWPEVEAFVAGEFADGTADSGDGTADSGDGTERAGSVADRPGDAPVGTALDLGCGNGRHAELLADRAGRVVGVDASRELLGEAATRARERGFDVELLQGDAARLPVADASVDLALYVATLHHLTTAADRRASLDELARVLVPGGRALVSAWSTAHERFGGDGTEASRPEGFETTVDWTLPGGGTVPRYYYVYSPDEFREVLESSALDVVAVEVSSGNCYAVVSG